VSDRTRYLLAYDIREPRRLRRIHSVASGYGEPLQYSLFACDLTRSELLMLNRDLRNEIDSTVDSIAIFDLGPPATRGVACVAFLGVHRALPDSGPTIW
jgi:CRISPR-associated protein Cas2